MKMAKRFSHLSTVVLLGLGLTCNPTLAASKLPSVLTTELPPLIRAQNFRCDTLDLMTLHAHTERGDVYRVVCNEANEHYRYRLTLTPNHTLYIKPWSE